MKENKSKYADKYQFFVVDPNNYEYDPDEAQKDPLNFGFIVKAKEKKTGRDVAIHQLDESDSNDNADISKIFLRELEFYVGVKSYLGIPTFIGYYFAPEKSIVTEYLKNGRLTKFYSKLKKNNQRQVDLWTDTFKARLTFGIACTMMHLHTFKAIHRRLNADVICFDDEYNPKVTEFAFSKIQINTKPISDLRLRTNSFYVSPEIKNDKVASTKSDVFSFGVLLLSIVQGNEDFQIDPQTGMLKIPEETPKLVSSIITNCTNEDPAKRPSFAQIVKALKDSQKLFPDTDENEYHNFVDRYMQNVQISPQDKPLLTGMPRITKKKKSNKRRTAFSSSSYSKASKKESSPKSFGKTYSQIHQEQKSQTQSSKKANSQINDEQNVSPKSSSQRSKLGFSSSNTKSGKKHIPEKEYNSDDEEIDESMKKSSQRSKLGFSSSNTKSSKRVEIEADDSKSHSDEDKEKTDSEDETNDQDESSSDDEVDIKISSDDDDHDDSEPEIVEVDPPKGEFYSQSSEVLPVDTSSDEEEFIFVNTTLKDFLKKANDGEPFAMLRVGRAYQKGELNAKINKEEAFNWYKKAADAGHPIGLYNYATCKKKGIGTEIDEEEAFRAMKEAAQKQNNNPMAMNTYAKWLLEKDPIGNQKEALTYFENSMKQGNSDATFSAAKIYASTNQIEKAKRAYLNAGELGIYAAYNNYALLCLQDKATRNEGILILKQNASRNNPESNYNLGLIDLEGKYNCECNSSSAFNYFRKAAHLNHPNACFHYARMLANGEGDVPKNPKRAADYYRKGISLGDIDSMINYAIMLQKDNIEGVNQDLEKAASLFKEAADEGNKFAMKKYAQCLSKGQGVEKDEDLAEEYNNRAKA